MKYTDWTSGEPIEKEWAMTGPTDSALRRFDRAIKTGGFGKEDQRVIRAALAAAEAAPLDVERLARVLMALDGDAIRSMDRARIYAVNIIDGYAALRSPDTETPGEAG